MRLTNSLQLGSIVSSIRVADGGEIPIQEVTVYNPDEDDATIYVRSATVPVTFAVGKQLSVSLDMSAPFANRTFWGINTPTSGSGYVTNGAGVITSTCSAATPHAYIVFPDGVLSNGTDAQAVYSTATTPVVGRRIKSDSGLTTVATCAPMVSGFVQDFGHISVDGNGAIVGVQTPGVLDPIFTSHSQRAAYSFSVRTDRLINAPELLNPAIIYRTDNSNVMTNNFCYGDYYVFVNENGVVQSCTNTKPIAGSLIYRTDESTALTIGFDSDNTLIGIGSYIYIVSDNSYQPVADVSFVEGIGATTGWLTNTGGMVVSMLYRCSFVDACFSGSTRTFWSTTEPVPGQAPDYLIYSNGPYTGFIAIDGIQYTYSNGGRMAQNPCET